MATTCACGTVLSRYNNSGRCSICERKARDTPGQLKAEIAVGDDWHGRTKPFAASEYTRATKNGQGLCAETKCGNPATIAQWNNLRGGYVGVCPDHTGPTPEQWAAMHEQWAAEQAQWDEEQKLVRLEREALQTRCVNCHLPIDFDQLTFLGSPREPWHRDCYINQVEARNRS